MNIVSSTCVGLTLLLAQTKFAAAQVTQAGQGYDYGYYYPNYAGIGPPVAYDSGPCCEAIQANMPGSVIFPNTAQYSAEKISYWSLEESDVSPACFVRPASTLEVSTIIQILNKPQYDAIPSCKIAVRSGGHQTWGGASNMERGVTIDLSDLNKITVNERDNIVTIGPGNSWQNVYDALEPFQLAVSGGRWGSVGVGGLLTGGGLSFFQGKYSLGCDNVANHEVVLSNGTIVNANPIQNADLHKALKGGNNNFGIVTRFDVRAFQQGQIWSGHAYSSPGRQNIPFRWFEHFASSSNNDLGGMTMLYANYTSGGWVSQSFTSYVKPQENPQVFAGLRNASSSVHAEITTMQDVARENSATTPSGTRSSFSTFTIINSAKFMDALLDFGAEYANKLPTLSTMNLIFQPLWTRPRVRSFAYGGGNVLGLENEKRDLVVVLIHTTWGDPARSNEIKQSMEKFIRQAQELARKMDVYHPYLYLNYAESFQDVMSSYGPESMSFMLNTSQKYDPIQLWQKRVPGGFKLRRRETSEVLKEPPTEKHPPEVTKEPPTEKHPPEVTKEPPTEKRPPTNPYDQYQPIAPGDQYPPTYPYDQYQPIAQGDQYPPTYPYDQYQQITPGYGYPPTYPYDQYQPIAPGYGYPPTDPYGQYQPLSQWNQYPPTYPYNQYQPTAPGYRYPPTEPYGQAPPMSPYSQYPPMSPYGQYPTNGPSSQYPSTAPSDQQPSSGVPVSQLSPLSASINQPTASSPVGQSSPSSAPANKLSPSGSPIAQVPPRAYPPAVPYPPPAAPYQMVGQSPSIGLYPLGY